MKRYFLKNSAFYFLIICNLIYSNYYELNPLMYLAIALALLSISLELVITIKNNKGD